MINKLTLIEEKLLDTKIIMDTYFKFKLLKFSYYNDELKIKSSLSMSFKEIENNDINEIIFVIKHELKENQIREIVKKIDKELEIYKR